LLSTVSVVKQLTPSLFSKQTAGQTNGSPAFFDKRIDASEILSQKCSIKTKHEEVKEGEEGKTTHETFQKRTMLQNVPKPKRW